MYIFFNHKFFNPRAPETSFKTVKKVILGQIRGQILSEYVKHFKDLINLHTKVFKLRYLEFYLKSLHK